MMGDGICRSSSKKQLMRFLLAVITFTPSWRTIFSEHIMTKAKLWVNVAAVMLFCMLLLILAALSGWFHAFLKDYTSIFLAVAAAYLAFCFQRRQSFLTNLRELWHKCIDAKAELIDYTHNKNPTQESFGKAHRAISTAIDMVRGVYCNIRETDSSIGLYPFEPLHDMRRALERLGFQNVSHEQRETERKKIMVAWNAFRWSFLQEFSTPSPTHYLIEHNASDPRRSA